MDKNKRFSLGIYEKAYPEFITWEERFKLAVKAGFDFIEISIDETDDRLNRLDDPRFVVQIRKLVDKYNVQIGSICLSGHRKYPLGSEDKQIQMRALEIGYKTIELAQNLGIPVIQLAGYDVYYEQSSQETINTFGNNLVKLVDYSAVKGIILAFETMETDFMNTVTKAMAYVDKIKSPYLQVYPDIGNVLNGTGSMDALVNDIRDGHGHIAAAHLKESKPGIFRDLEYGEGCVDFDKSIAALWEVGVRRFVCEYWYRKDEDYELRLNSNYKFISDILHKY